MIRLEQSQLLESKTQNLERFCKWLGVDLPDMGNRSVGWYRHKLIQLIMSTEKKIDLNKK